MLHRARTQFDTKMYSVVSDTYTHRQPETRRSNRDKKEAKEAKTKKVKQKKKTKSCETSDGCDLEKWWLNKASEFCGAPVIYTHHKNSILLIKGAAEWVSFVRTRSFGAVRCVCVCAVADDVCSKPNPKIMYLKINLNWHTKAVCNTRNSLHHTIDRWSASTQCKV